MISQNNSRIEPMNRYNRPSLRTIGGKFSLSQRERAGVRENCSNENVMRFYVKVYITEIPLLLDSRQTI